MLCQIGSCCLYAERWGRVTVVDANFHCSRHFRDTLSKYFVSRRDDLFLDLTHWGPRLNQLSTQPPEIFGRVADYDTADAPRQPYRLDRASGAPLTFDFTRDHAAELLVHHAGGRSPHALEALARLRLHGTVRAEIVRRLQHIGGPFQALHVRATDYDSDYRSAISALRGKLTGRVFLATDNRDVLDFARSECRDAEIFSFAALPDVAGTPLHYIGDPQSAGRRNLDAIADLMMLAHAETLHFLQLSPNAFGAKFSGYSILAQQILQSKPLLRGLMAPEPLT